MEIINFEKYKEKSNCEGCLTPNGCVECYLEYITNKSTTDERILDYFVDNYRDIRKELYG